MSATLLVDGIAAGVPADDRGLAYGDGVFRTLTVAAGEPRHWTLQYRKLAADCAALGISCPAEAPWRADIAAAVGTADAGVLKLIVTRGSGRRGYAPGGAAPRRVVSFAPLPDYPAAWREEGVTARWCDLRLAIQPRLAGIKHLNRLENVLARAEWNDPAIAEGLLCDLEGRVVEGCMSNLFWGRAGRLHTPALSRCGVAGLQRERLLAADLEVAVGDFSPADLLAADEVFLCNSVIGVWPVSRLEQYRWPVGPLTRWARSILESDS